MEAAAATPTQGECFTPLELRAWRGLLRAHASLVKTLDARMEAEHRLALSSFEVLVHLSEADKGRMRMHDIASSVLLSRSGLTRLVDRLERDELVRRVSCEDDARGAFACITDAGRAKLGEARVTHVAGVREHFLELFSAAELEVLGGFWARLLSHMGCGKHRDA